MRLKAIHALQHCCVLAPAVWRSSSRTDSGLRSRVSRCSSATWRMISIVLRYSSASSRSRSEMSCPTFAAYHPSFGTLCPVLGLWPLWCGMHRVSLGTLVSYPLHVGCHTLALPSVPSVVQGGMRTDSGLLHDACWIVEALPRTNPSTAFRRFSWLNPWALREISTPSSSSKLHSWITS
jgi:hypothetical protein